MMKIWGFDKEEINRAVGILRDEAKYLDHKDAVEKVQATREARKSGPKSKKYLGEVADFWKAHHAAQLRVQSEFGVQWYLDKNQYYMATVPPKFRSIKGQAVAKHKMPPDIKVPLACYWPGGSIPEIGMTLYKGR
jgi:hypothetical protein